MKHLMRPLFVFALALLASCGGGGGVDTGGTGGAVPAGAGGPIAGFGSVFVGGVRFDDSAAEVEDFDGNRRTRDDLRLGMTVEIESGAVADVAGQPAASARRIRVESELAGFVAAVDLAGETFTVLGQRVAVDAATVFDERLAGGFAGLAPGQAVEVYAEFDAASQRYRATRVEPATAGSTLLRLRGPVAEVSPLLGTLRIGSVQYRYDRADGVPANLAPGTWVRLRLAFVPNPLASWDVQRFSLALREWADTDDLRLEGRVSARGSGGSFAVNGRAVDGSAVALPSSLVLGARVEVWGGLRGGLLRATRVEVRTEAEFRDREFRLESAITAVDVAAGTLQLRGLTVSTRRADLRVDCRPPAAVAVGQRVDLRARLAADRRTLEATRITCS
ncbi:MAG: DUF5666 domain-containing protein [Betaproteobacteria bacterium]